MTKKQTKTKKKRREEVPNLDLYRLSDEDCSGDDLEVSSGSVVTLSASPRHASAVRPRLLQTSDLDELKTWIGVPDAVAKGRCAVDPDQRREMRELCELCKEGESDESGESVALAQRLREGTDASAKVDSIRAHAHSYLYGDSSLIAEAKPVIEGYFEAFAVPTWLFPKVKVASGSVLWFGPGANVLSASELEIEEGGRVISYGSLTVNVATLRKTTPQILAEAIDFPAFATNFRLR